MKVLVVGSGGREHAIVYALAKSPKVAEIHAIPGNPGIAKIGVCHAGSVEDLDGILRFVEENKIDLTVVGPEVPLCLGLADVLEAHGHKVFGPKKAGAILEGSKAYSKAFMERHHIPTAKYVETNNYEDAVVALKNFSYPVVVKADGLAAGKGVVICEDEEMAKETLKDFLVNGALNSAGSTVILEEFLTGFECSLLCFVDNKTIVPMISVKDHKQIFDGNKGPNTGGMGTASPNPFITEEIEGMFEEDILKPFLDGLHTDGIDYRGVIFIGLMIENKKAKVLEFNVRFGDPETQSIMLRLDSDLFDIMNSVASNELDARMVRFNNQTAVTLVLASDGYPGKYEKGKEITGLDEVKDVTVFHAGTKMVDDKIVTNGGRVLNICALGNSLEEAREKVYRAAKVINFEGKYYRNDIGLV